MTRRSHIKLRHIVPSMVTVFAICAGMTSVRMSLEGHLENALYFILIAVFLDAADGKLARFLDTASPFGAELDTLADFFNFGIVPGILIYNTLYIGTDHTNLGWLATLVLAVCCALRLARFNLSQKSAEISMKTDDHFVGVPAPALACLALMPVSCTCMACQMPVIPSSARPISSGSGCLRSAPFPRSRSNMPASTASTCHSSSSRQWFLWSA